MRLIYKKKKNDYRYGTLLFYASNKIGVTNKKWTYGVTV